MSGRDDLAKENVFWHAATLLWDSGKEVDGKSSAGKGLQIQNTKYKSIKYKKQHTKYKYDIWKYIQNKNTINPEKEVDGKSSAGKGLQGDGSQRGMRNCGNNHFYDFPPCRILTWQHLEKKNYCILVDSVLRNQLSNLFVVRSFPLILLTLFGQAFFGVSLSGI